VLYSNNAFKIWWCRRAKLQMATNNYSTFRNLLVSRLAVILWILCLTGVAKAQEQQDTKAKLDRMIAELDSLVVVASKQAALDKPDPYLNDVYVLFNNSLENERKAPPSAVLENRKSQFRRDKGLNFEAGYLQNFDQGVFGAEGIYYNRRYQAGVRWDILKGGWLDHSRSVEALDREQEIRAINRERGIRQQQYHNLQTAVEAILNRQQINHLSNYQKLLATEQQRLRTLYDLGYKSWEEILSVVEQKSVITTELQTLRQHQQDLQTTQTDAALPSDLPVLELNLDPLLQEAQRNPEQARIDSLRLANIREQENPWRDIRVTANLDYNYYVNRSSQLVLNANGDREYFSLGLSASVPFTILSNSKEATVQAYEKDFSYENAQETASKTNKLRTLAADYEQLLVSYKAHYYKHFLLTEKALRAGLTRTDADGTVRYSPAATFDVLMKQFTVKRQLIEAKRNLYQKLLQLQEVVGQFPLAEYTSLWQPPKSLMDEPMGTDIYLWSHTFELYPNELLWQYINSRDYQTVLLSPGKSDTAKVLDFVREASASGKKVYLMKGQQNLIEESNWNQIGAFADYAKEVGANGIHLDVEPQTKDDWNQNRENYLSDYSAMVRKAREVTQRSGLRLSISIPVYFDDILSEICPNVDELYVMAYGSANSDKISERIAEEYEATRNTGTDLKVVVRHEDFASKVQMVTLVQQIKEVYKQTMFAVHDLSRTINIED